MFSEAEYITRCLKANWEQKSNAVKNTWMLCMSDNQVISVIVVAVAVETSNSR